MRLYLFTFGKLKTPGLLETTSYYRQLIRPWLELEEVEMKPLPVFDKSPENRLILQKKEGHLLLEQIEKKTKGRGSYHLMDEKGKAYSTQQWTTLLQKWKDQGSIPECLCIGSSLGFSEEVRRGAGGLFSLGPQTLSHELARVVLLEQLYRAESVLRGHPYHNEGC